jgi:high-affinity nickel permease
VQWLEYRLCELILLNVEDNENVQSKDTFLTRVFGPGTVEVMKKWRKLLKGRFMFGPFDSRTQIRIFTVKY